MHEKLKMRVNLGCSMDDSGNGTPHVTENQPICGRMDHGTFYMIYMELSNYKKFTGASGDVQHQYEVNFFLQNFDGPITIGLVEEQDIFPVISNIVPTENQDLEELYDYQIKIQVQPFNSNNSLKNRIWVFDEPLTQKVFDVEIDMITTPSTLFQRSNLDGSQYIDPFLLVRDGEHYYKVHYSRNEPSANANELEEAFGSEIINLLRAHDQDKNTSLVNELRQIKERGYGRPKTRECYPRRFKTI